jgi:hypothetical protein
MAGASPAAHGVFAVNHLRLVLGSTAKNTSVFGPGPLNRNDRVVRLVRPGDPRPGSVSTVSAKARRSADAPHQGHAGHHAARDPQAR